MRHERGSNGSGTHRHSSESAPARRGSTRETARNGKETNVAGPDPLKLLLGQFRELGEYLSYYVTARTDSVKLSLRSLAAWTVAGAIGFVALCGLVVTASWFLLSGLAAGLAELFGERPWAGNFATGLLTLAALALGAYYTVEKWQRASRERTVQKYEQRQAQQQAQFGHRVTDQASAAARRE